MTIRVVCSKGTYVRTLCADIGDRLGVGGHMSSLIRERVGPLMVERALTVDEVESRLKQGTLATSMLTSGRSVGQPSCLHRGSWDGSDECCTECRFPSRSTEMGRMAHVGRGWVKSGYPHEGRIRASAGYWDAAGEWGD